MQSHGINVGGVVLLEVGQTGQRPINTLVLPVNPQQTFQTNMRVTIVQTLDGLYIDNFGYGIQQISIAGTSAWNSAQGRFNGQHVAGNPAIQHLSQDIIKKFFDLGGVKGSNKNAYIRIYDDVTGAAYEVAPTGNEVLLRSPSSPLTVSYQYTFVVLKDLISGHQIQKAPDPVISTFTSPKSIQTYAASKVANAQAVTLGVKQTPYVRRQVQSGDTLYTIAQDYLPKQATVQDVDTFVNDIAALNSLGNPNLLFTGMLLRIPA